MKRGLIFMTFGGLLVAGALGLTLLNLYDDQQAEIRARQVVTVLEEQVLSPITETGSEPDLAVRDMQTVQINGQDYIGILKIPSLSLELPVQAEWSDSQLSTSPCRYDGSFLDDSMIVAGHNYRNHFGNLSNLRSGDEISFTDVIGKTQWYAVVETEIVGGFDIEGMKAGDWDLTLFTCNYSGLSRITARCERIEK